MVGLFDGEKNFEDMHNRIDRIPVCVGQTDIQTSCHGRHKSKSKVRGFT